LRPADMLRAEAVAEDNPEGTRAVEDNQAGAGSPEVAADIPAAEDIPVAAEGIPAVEDNQAGAGSPEVAADIPAAEDSPAAAEDSRVAVDIPVAAEDSRAAEEDNSRSAEAYRRMSYRTWRRKYCRGLPGFRNWGRR